MLFLFPTRIPHLRMEDKWDAYAAVKREYGELGCVDELVPQRDLQKPSADQYYLHMHGV